MKEAKPKKLSYELIQPESETGAPMYAMLEELVDQHHEDLARAAVKAVDAVVTAAEKRKPDAAFWKMLALVALPSIHSTPRKKVFHRRELPEDMADFSMRFSMRSSGKDKALAALSALREPALRGLLLELFLEERLEYVYGSYPDELAEAARYYRVDLEKLEASVRNEAEEKKTRSKTARKK